MENMIDILFADYDEKMAKAEQEKEKVEDDAKSPYLGDY